VNVEAVLYRNGTIRFNYGPAHSDLTPTIGVSCGDGTHCTFSVLNGAAAIPGDVSKQFWQPPLLPPGLSLGASGVISGAATQGGQYEFQIKAVDSGQPQQTDEGTFHLNVAQITFVETPTGGWKEVGDPLLLRVLVDGTLGQVTYQWVKDGIDLSGETSNTFDIEALTPDDEGWYSCRVTDEAKGTYETAPVLVRVFPEGALPATGLTGLCLVAVACGLAAVRAVSRKRG
jgi:hypothetical protein